MMPDQEPRRSVAAPALLVAATMIWGSAYIVLGHFAAAWPPCSYLAARMALGAVAALAMPWPGRASWREVRFGVALGGLNWACNLLGTLALVHTLPARAAFAVQSAAVLVPALAWAMGLGPWRRGTTAAGLVLLPGLALLLHVQPGAGLGRGDALALWSALPASLHVLVMARACRGAIGRTLLSTQLATTALLCGVSAVLGGEAWRWPSRVDLTALVYLGCGAAALGGALQAAGQRAVPPTQAGFIYALQPVWTALWVGLARRSAGGPGEIVGGLLILAAALLADRPLRWPRLATPWSAALTHRAQRPPTAGASRARPNRASRGAS